MITSIAPGRVGTELTTRRAVMIEALGVVAVLAIPVGVAFSTAEPMPNPPSREVLNVISAERLGMIQQRRDAAKARRRVARRQSALNERSERRRSVRPRPQRTPRSSQRRDASDP
jgi:hypothetical protein